MSSQREGSCRIPFQAHVKHVTRITTGCTWLHAQRACLLACLLVIRDSDPLPPLPLLQAAPDSHTARSVARSARPQILEVGCVLLLTAR